MLCIGTYCYFDFASNAIRIEQYYDPKGSYVDKCIV